LSGAVLYGSAQMVRDVGVRVVFNRMMFNGKAYKINAIAMDPSMSTDTVVANVDRKSSSVTSCHLSGRPRAHI